MQALILAGGEGTRLRPLTDTVPKPALPLAGRPHVMHMIDWVARHGVTEVIISCGFLADGLREALAGFEGPALRFVTEPEPRGTAGAIRFAEELLGDRFWVLNGDVLTDIDLTAQAEQHDRTGATATIALCPVEDPSVYGLVRKDEDGKVTEFLEKPEADQIDTNEINAGAYLLERSVLDLIEPERQVSIEREVFPKLIGHGLYGRRLDGYWLDIGTPERFLQGSRDILARRVQTVTGDALEHDGLAISPEATIAPDARVSPPVVIGDRVRIEAGAIIDGPVVIGSDSVIGEGARISGSVLLDGCVVGARATVGGAILAAGAEVASGAEVADGEVIGAEVGV